MLRATYRLQLTPELGFEHAAGIMPYLARLGVSHVYLSPIFEAVPGSTHGYDVTDPTRLRSELDGPSGFDALVKAARSAQLSIIIDIVPNHMAAHATNPWWWDVLKHGRQSACANIFDIDWKAGEDRLVVPTLGQSLDEVLQNGELTVATGSPQDAREPVLRYYDNVFPLRPDIDPERASMQDLVAAQHYRLMFWRDGERLLNYRRFFDIDELAAVRVEDQSVFERTHRLIAELVSAGKIDGVRVDHIDGLRDPTGYLKQLRGLLGEASPSTTPPIFVEKILMGDEQLPAAWHGDATGTTGYELINVIEPVYIDQDGFAQLERDAMEHDRIREPFDDLCHRSKLLVLDRLFYPEVDRLTQAIAEVAERAGLTVPVHDALRQAVMTVTAALDVYRTYHGDAPPDAETQQRLDRAFACAEEHLRTDDDARLALRVVDQVLVHLPYAMSDGALQQAAVNCIKSWQQLTGPAAAKGVEDTALYRHVVLSSLNEVGCEPVARSAPLDTFHAANAHRRNVWPQSMLATATHDTKRGEDTRARINVLSELAAQWTDAMQRWSDWHRPMQRQLDGGPCPNQTHESLLYQSLIGIWPPNGALDEAVTDRLSEYMVKAARESKRRTSWRLTDDAYEAGLRAYTRELVLGDGGERFRDDVQPILRHAMFFGAINSLSRMTAKLMAPGVPDIYQGTEFWDLSLVDPDNRCPVNYEQRGAALDSSSDVAPADLREQWRDGRIKLAVLHALLQLRRNHAAFFTMAGYEPLRAAGEHADRIWAFARRDENECIIALGIRLCANLTDPDDWPIGRLWSSTRLQLPPDVRGSWRCAIHETSGRSDGEAVDLHDVFRSLPIAVLQFSA